MFKNYLTTAIRNLTRHKIYSFINIAGLAIGMACCVIILLYVQNELSYDQFHQNSDRIYRVLRETRSNNGTPTIQAGTSGPLGPTLAAEFPEVESAVRMSGYGDFTWMRYQNKQHNHPLKSCYLVDTNMFDMFDFPFTYGNKETALKSPNSLIITQKVARLYFNNEDPTGRVVAIQSPWAQGDFTITGVIDLPETSALQFNLLISENTGTPDSWLRGLWENWQGTYRLRPIQTFIKLREGEDPKALEAKLPAFMAQHMGQEVEAYNTYHLQPFSRIHLHNNTDYSHLNFDFSSEFLKFQYGNIQNVYQFTAIACLVLAIACVNFMNLSTARSANRAREVGIRKAAGAHRLQLIRQFLGESMLLAFLAFILAIVLVILILPYFNAFLDIHISPYQNLSVVIGIFGCMIVAGLLAGIYPAFFLSAFNPIDVLKGRLTTGPQRGNHLREALVVFQFAISILLIIGTATIYRQLNYLQTKDLGFNKEHLVTLPIFRIDRVKKTDYSTLLAARYQTVKDAFLAHPNVQQATAHRMEMGTDGGVLRQVDLENGQVHQAIMQEADADYLKTYEIEIITGTPFVGDHIQTNKALFLLNETAVKQFGLSDPIGKRVGAGTVVGIMKDFHGRPLHETIRPMILRNLTRFLNYLTLRVEKNNLPETMAFLEKTWKQFLPDQPFEYVFMDERLNTIYNFEMKVGHLSSIFALLAIFVACLGLLGLASFSATQRTKEIGVRKILGASVSNIVVLLSKDFIKWVLIANVLAWPTAYFVAQSWLNKFAYKTPLEIWIFVLSSVIACVIALSTVSLQAIRTAHTNPIDALRDE